MRISLQWRRRWRTEPMKVCVNLYHMQRSDHCLFIATANYLNQLQCLYASMDDEYTNDHIMVQSIRNAMDTIFDLVMTYEDYEELSSLLHSDDRRHGAFNFESMQINYQSRNPVGVVELLIIPPIERLENPMVTSRRNSNDIARAA